MNSQLVPVLTGSSLRNKGVQPLLDAVVRYLPSPADVPPVQGIDPYSGEVTMRAAGPQGAVFRLGLQDRYGSFCRSIGLCACLLRQLGLRHDGI